MGEVVLLADSVVDATKSGFCGSNALLYYSLIVFPHSYICADRGGNQDSASASD